MVSRSYMEAQRPRPTSLKRFVDQQVMPAAIDLAGGMEAGLERLATTVRQRPATVLAASVALGAAVPFLMLLACSKSRMVRRKQ